MLQSHLYLLFTPSELLLLPFIHPLFDNPMNFRQSRALKTVLPPWSQFPPFLLSHFMFGKENVKGNRKNRKEWFLCSIRRAVKPNPDPIQPTKIQITTFHISSAFLWLRSCLQQPRTVPSTWAQKASLPPFILLSLPFFSFLDPCSSCMLC